MRFRVEIDGLKAGEFFEVVFPEARIEAGREQLTRLVLRRAASTDRDLSEWWQQMAHGRPTPRNVAVILLDTRGQEPIRWNFVGAQPVRYSLSPLNAMEPALLMETIELEIENFKRG
ncbi:MAG TPA: phage tail protein [Bryobacteraceae bacterium]|nr:phage tail protein [Bryobacteraceae bacterium]